MIDTVIEEILDNEDWTRYDVVRLMLENGYEVQDGQILNTLTQVKYASMIEALKHLIIYQL